MTKTSTFTIFFFAEVISTRYGSTRRQFFFFFVDKWLCYDQLRLRHVGRFFFLLKKNQIFALNPPFIESIDLPLRPNAESIKLKILPFDWSIEVQTTTKTQHPKWPWCCIWYDQWSDPRHSHTIFRWQISYLQIQNFLIFFSTFHFCFYHSVTWALQLHRFSVLLHIVEFGPFLFDVDVDVYVVVVYRTTST